MASLAGWHHARRVIIPLEAVAHAAREIAEGNFKARAKVSGKVFGEAENLIDDFNDMAERLERAEAELRYWNSAIAHELRTPLTILKGRLHGLLSGVFAPSPALYGGLLSHVDGLACLVEDLRTLGLFSVDRLELKLEEFNLATEAEFVIASIEDELGKAGIRTKLVARPVTLHADKSRIRQALLAILDNARRYAPNSMVTVETRPHSHFAVIRVSDTGPGLPLMLSNACSSASGGPRFRARVAERDLDCR